MSFSPSPFPSPWYNLPGSRSAPPGVLWVNEPILCGTSGFALALIFQSGIIMWLLRETETYATRRKRYQKNHPKELAAVLKNLDRYLETLQAGIKPLQISYGFLHDEGKGVAAIDQRGGGSGKLAQTRL
jgi:hypothetical protein